MIADRKRRQRRRPRRSRGGAGSRWVTSPGGTITFQVYDMHRHVTATYVGTCTTGGEPDPKNNMVPDVCETGHGDGEGKQQ